MAFLITFILALFIASSEGTLSYRSDGPNVEYKSLLRNLELTPYVLHDGSWYRDMLTIEASKAVGQYARKYDYQPYEYYQKKVRTQCFKNHKKVSFRIASEASYVRLHFEFKCDILSTFCKI